MNFSKTTIHADWLQYGLPCIYNVQCPFMLNVSFSSSQSSIKIYEDKSDVTFSQLTLVLVKDIYHRDILFNNSLTVSNVSYCINNRDCFHYLKSKL
jgi:hypothetical protein